MLARMFGTDADHVHDRITDFSRPVTGSFYFAPSLTTLAELSDRWAASLNPVAMSEETAAPSLRAS